MSGCIRTTAGVKIVCYLDSRLVFYDSDDFKSHRPAWIHDLKQSQTLEMVEKLLKQYMYSTIPAPTLRRGV